jgi:hypothetical protein
MTYSRQDARLNPKARGKGAGHDAKDGADLEDLKNS